MKVTIVVFSPGGTTKVYAGKLAESISGEYEIIDLTEPEARKKTHYFTKEDLVIFASPVYSGRIPQVEGRIFNKIYGNDTPGVFLVTYGNRAYEDALLELAQIAECNGFLGIGGAAYVAPHSLSPSVAAEHPTENDLKQLAAFGKRMKQIILYMRDDPCYFEQHNMTIKGNFPYKNYKRTFFIPGTDKKKCCLCGACIQRCPAGAIRFDGELKTDPDKCISCTRCIYVCPEQAKSAGSDYERISAELAICLKNIRHVPEHFYLDQKFLPRRMEKE